MKIAFSTVGCPDWSWAEIVASAKDLGYDGVELRGVGGCLHLPSAKEFSGLGLTQTLAVLARTGLCIPCLASSSFLHETSDDACLNEGKDYIDLAKALNCPCIRVLGDTNPEPEADLSVEPLVIQRLRILGEYAASKGVQVLLETNGIFADSRLMAEVMSAVGRLNIGVLWDIHHTYRFFGENPISTWATLGPYIKHMHIKDSIFSNGVIKYTLIGQGDVPTTETLRMVDDDGYKGYVSLEWVKRWRPDLEEPGLVFPHFIEYIKQMRG